MPYANGWPVRVHDIMLLMLLFVGVGTAGAQSANRYTLSGYVRDAESGESLIGASLYERSLGLGTTTNTYGFFSLTLPTGPVRVVVSYIGFAPQVVELDLASNQQLTIELEPVTEELEEIEVIAEQGEEF